MKQRWWFYVLTVMFLSYIGLAVAFSLAISIHRRPKRFFSAPTVHLKE
jgi:hypothetical protein